MNKILFKTFLKTAGVGAKLELTPESNESVDDLSRLITRWPLFLLLVLLHSWTTTLIYYTHVSKIIVSNGPHESRDPWVEKISVHRLVVKQLPVGNSRRRIPCIIKFWISLNTSTIQTEKLSNWEPSAQIHYRTYHNNQKWSFSGSKKPFKPLLAILGARARPIYGKFIQPKFMSIQFFRIPGMTPDPQYLSWL